jgi:hypothetical protein
LKRVSREVVSDESDLKAENFDRNEKDFRLLDSSGREVRGDSRTKECLEGLMTAMDLREAETTIGLNSCGEGKVDWRATERDSSSDNGRSVSKLWSAR